MKSKLAVALLWILVFLLGGVAGAVSHYLYWTHLRPFAPAGPPTLDDIVNGMGRELKLDSKQKESLKAIFEKSFQQYFELNKKFGPQYEALNKQYLPQFEEINRQYRPEWEAIRNETDEKIKQILRPDQRAKYEDFLKKVYAPMPSGRGMPLPR